MSAATSQRPLRIAVVIKQPGFLRYVQTQLEGLCAKGHALHIAVQDAPIKDEDGLLHAFAARFPQVSVGYALPRRDDWSALARDLRGSMDFCRYLHPDYAHAVELRKRIRGAGGSLGQRLDQLGRLIGAHRSKAAARAFMGVLRSAYSSIPPDPDILEYVRQLDLDLLLVTGLVWQDSNQADYVLAARKLGVPSGYVVNSWDNLTNKGDIKVVPDAVYVWNDPQRNEAIRHHGVPPDRVKITGAPLFDRWFERRPSKTRSEFLQRMGLSDDRPYVLYTCSSQAIAPARSELNFFKNWLRALRSSPSPALREVNVLLRPHPSNVEVWNDFDLEDARLVIHPRHGRWTVREKDRDDYYHALRYCSAVVGINTSAMLEAAILGVRTLSIRSGRFAAMQEGTLHFHHLTKMGVVEIHSQLPEHLVALEGQIGADTGGPRQSLPGVIPFVRPRGAERSSTKTAISMIEAQARAGVSHRALPLWRPVMSPMVQAGVLARLVNPNAGAKRKPSKVDLLDREHQPTRLQRFYGRHVFPWLIDNSLKLLPSAGLREIVLEQVGAGERSRISEVEEALAEVMNSDCPILVGPWLSEVGFEVLYWIPFVRWFRKHTRIGKDRMIVVSRGGTSRWYSGISSNYVDVLDIFTPEEFRDRNLHRTIERGHQKQSGVSEMDREIYDEVARRLGLERYVVLHPWIMFRLFSRFWKGVGGGNFVDNYTRFEPIELKSSKVDKITAALPKRYVAVKFYFRESLPNTPKIQKFIADLLVGLSQEIDVVVLSSGSQIDDHSDFRATSGHRIHWIDPMTNPARNLDLQAAVISRSVGFVGTYGGLSYVANLLGKTAICFEAESAYNRNMHTELAMRKLRAFGGRLYVLDIEDLDAFQALFAGLVRGQGALLENTAA